MFKFVRFLITYEAIMGLKVVLKCINKIYLIGIEEIVCVRDMIKKLLKQYLCYAKYDTKSKSISNYKFEEHTKNSTKNKVYKLMFVLLGCLILLN